MEELKMDERKIEMMMFMDKSQSTSWDDLIKKPEKFPHGLKFSRRGKNKNNKQKGRV
jgi:hypothetical protein